MSGFGGVLALQGVCYRGSAYLRPLRPCLPPIFSLYKFYTTLRDIMDSNHCIPICSIAQNPLVCIIIGFCCSALSIKVHCSALQHNWAVLRRKSGLDGMGTSCAGKGQRGVSAEVSGEAAKNGKILKLHSAAFSQNIYIISLAIFPFFLSQFFHFWQNNKKGYGRCKN